MTNGLLLLHPVELNLEFPEPDRIIKHLRNAGLAGETSPYSKEILLPGEAFLRRITFLGCSPFIRLQPESKSDRGFCHITITGPTKVPTLRHGRNTRPPICPNCHKRISDWQEMTCPETGRQLFCSNCNTPHTTNQLIWKNSAGIARLFIEIHNIFPGEAVPDGEFISLLGKTLGGKWKYFYLLPHETTSTDNPDFSP